MHCYKQDLEKLAAKQDVVEAAEQFFQSRGSKKGKTKKVGGERLWVWTSTVGQIHTRYPWFPDPSCPQRQHLDMTLPKCLRWGLPKFNLTPALFAASRAGRQEGVQWWLQEPDPRRISESAWHCFHLSTWWVQFTKWVQFSRITGGLYRVISQLTVVKSPMITMVIISFTAVLQAWRWSHWVPDTRSLSRRPGASEQPLERKKWIIFFLGKHQFFEWENINLMGKHQFFEYTFKILKNPWLSFWRWLLMVWHGGCEPLEVALCVFRNHAQLHWWLTGAETPANWDSFMAHTHNPLTFDLCQIKFHIT